VSRGSSAGGRGRWWRLEVGQHSRVGSSGPSHRWRPTRRQTLARPRLRGGGAMGWWSAGVGCGVEVGAKEEE
jgi:hypothetical protein